LQIKGLSQKYNEHGHNPSVHLALTCICPADRVVLEVGFVKVDDAAATGGDEVPGRDTADADADTEEITLLGAQDPAGIFGFGCVVRLEKDVDVDRPPIQEDRLMPTRDAPEAEGAPLSDLTNDDKSSSTRLCRQRGC